jgi:hypothetical protein
MSSLKTIFARVTETGADWLPAGVSFAGPDDVDDTSRFPRITWNPITALHGKPRRLGGGPGDDGEIMQRQWSIRVDVWAADLSATEDLVNAFLASAHELLSSAGYHGGQEVWNPGGRTASGCVCAINFQLLTPVPRKPKPFRTITGVASTTTLVTS